MNVTWITERAEQIRAIQREIEQPGCGRSQFRRVVDARPFAIIDSASAAEWDAGRASEGMRPFNEWGPQSYTFLFRLSTGSVAGFPSPYGKPGDLVYVREAHYIAEKGRGVAYAVDNAPLPKNASVSGFSRLRSPVTMPRWASRYTLLIEDVWGHRVRDISEADAEAEGVNKPYDIAVKHLTDAPYRTSFMRLWESLHGPGSWDRNDWVWAAKFRPIAANVDDVLADPARFGVETGR